MRRGVAIVATGLLGLSGASGCYSFTTLGRARTVGKGHYEVFAAPEALGVVSGSGGAIRPVVDAGLRYEVSDDVDLSARIGTLGLTLGPRIQLRRSPQPTSGLDIAAAPAVAYTYTDKLALEAPVSFGLNLGRHQLVLSPRAVYQMRFGVAGQTAPASFVYAGASLGAALQVTEGLALLPEIAALGEVYADPGFASNLSRAVGLQGAVGFLFDL